MHSAETTFAALLADRRAAAEAELRRHLDALSHDRTIPARLAGAMRHAVLAGGKRFRPFLVLETAAMLGAKPASALPAAAAVELIHCYSLVHDDLPAMDDDDLRRGEPTVHIAFDEATAILAGDALQALAFEVLADPGNHLDPRSQLGPGVRIEWVRILGTASGLRGMAGGQQLDLDAQAQPDASADAIARIQAMKTGALIAAAVDMGAVAAGATNDQRESLAAYARNLGLAFQISDDILDATGDARAVGKATGKDGAAGKATFVGLLGLEGARTRLAQTEASARAALEPFGPAADVLRDATRLMAARKS